MSVIFFAALGAAFGGVLARAFALFAGLRAADADVDFDDFAAMVQRSFGAW